MQQKQEFDYLIIGGGVIGSAVFDALCMYKTNVALIEKAHDVGTKASGANSGIVHAGYDCKPNTLKAKFNVEGNALMWSVVNDLSVPSEQCGSLVLAEKNQLNILEHLREQGIKNGVETKIVSDDELKEIEANLTQNIKYGLYANSAGVVSPYKLTIAYADRGILNGGKIFLDCGVKNIEKVGKYFNVYTPSGIFSAKTVINAAGEHGAEINDMLGYEHFETKYRRGEYCLLDKSERKNIFTVLFPLPTEKGKGILVAPTADGNVIYGPTSIDTEVGDTETTYDGLNEIKNGISNMYAKPNMSNVIRVYAGLRTIIGDDFIVKKSEYDKHFYMAIGICSPGLTSAPAIAKYISEEIQKSDKLKKKNKVVIKLQKEKRIVDMTPDETKAFIGKDTTKSNIICKCEKVTEYEILKAIHSPLGARTVEAVKKRVRAGMGKCQGGFCQPKIVEILSRELKIPITEVRKDSQNSNIAVSKIKGLPSD